jgi:hypothetical protein
MHNKPENRMKRVYTAVRLCMLLGFAGAVLNGCALLYFPLLLFVPLQPIIMTVAKVAAKFGPLLLMLVVEADPQLIGTPETLIAVQPAEFTSQTQLKDLESQLLYETAHTPGLVSASIVDVDSLSEKWLNEQLADAARNGCTIRLVLVDSRNYRTGKVLSEDTLIRLADSGVPIRTVGTLAGRVGGACAQQRTPQAPASRICSNAAYASYAGALLPELQ